MRRINIKYLLVSIILILSLILGAGCELLPEIDFGTPTPAPALPATPVPLPTPTATPINPGYSAPPPVSSSPALPDIASVVAKVRPSVAAISTEVITYDIFRRPITQEGAGSGWIIDANGLIVTNNHVVEGAKTITVTLADNRSFTAELARTDPLTDLAVVKINADNLSAVQIGDSSRIRVGDWVVAIGNALGRGISAKEGIISRIGVSIDVDEGQTLYDLLETSAAINPGNSGGPLVNMAGEVIGMTSAKLAAVGVEGMGYAISANTAKPIIEELIKKGYVVRPWLGVAANTVNQWLAARYSLSVNQGAFITQVVQGSPADKAGLAAGDIIVSFGSIEVKTAEELVRAIHASQIGQQVAITFWRGNAKSVASATLAESPQS